MDWVCTWGCALYYGDDTGDDGKRSALRVSKMLGSSTFRQIIRTSIGGEQLRLTFSNEYGETPMVLKAVHVARATTPTRSDIDVASDTVVTFDGAVEVVIPAFGKVTSDPVCFKAGALERLAVSIFFEDVPQRVACHVGARANSFIAQGDAVSLQVLDGADICTHWFVLARIDVTQLKPICSVVVLGDSITDGYGVTDEQYTRWTDTLAERLQENQQTQNIGVVNMGIGGNHLLNDENPVAAIKRFERDVLDIAGVKYFVLFIGVNDLAFAEHPVSAESIIKAYEDMIKRARSDGITVLVCTILPYACEDARRHEINDWLREKSGQTDCGFRLIDFDELLRDPANPEYMLPDFDNDGIHPNFAAYKKMGNLAYEELIKYTNLLP